MRGRVLAPSAVVGGRGELYVLFMDVGDDRLDYEGGHRGDGGAPYDGRFSLVLARSLDRGSSWSESVVDERVVPTRRFISFLAPFAALAVDRRRGRLYVAFEDARLGSPDVYVRSLAPGSATWSAAVRVNDTPRGDRSWQYLPQLAVAADGRVDVVYYDRRLGGRANLRNEVSLQSSHDGAASFGQRLKLSSRSFDARIGAGAEQGLPDLGSRLGLASDDHGATAVWTDTRDGTDASHKQDLRSARVLVGDHGPSGNLRGLLLAGESSCFLAVGGWRSARVAEPALYNQRPRSYGYHARSYSGRRRREGLLARLRDPGIASRRIDRASVALPLAVAQRRLRARISPRSSLITAALPSAAT